MLNSCAKPAATAFDALDRCVVAYLTLPLAIFLLGWIEWWAAVPLVICLVYALRPALGSAAAPDAARRAPVTLLQTAVAVAVGCSWALLGGADHLLFANADWHIRDAVLHDLVASPWPVGYGTLDGLESMLRAPLGFYLPAALAGKAFGIAAAHVAMGMWTAAGATLFLLQVLSLTPSRLRTALWVSAVVVLWSGLDIVGSLLNDGPRFRSDWNITTHIEWWAGKFQYSSMTTQLFWVPNHALGGWLAIGLLFRHARCPQLTLLWPLLVVAVALWSPLTAIGLVPFVAWRVGTEILAERSWRVLNPLVWGPAAAIGLVVAAYLVLDTGGIDKGVTVGGTGVVMDLLQQSQFFVLEVGLVGAVLYLLRPSAELVLALVFLALLPLAHLGPGNDLVMRGSIPSLAVLTLTSCLAITQASGGLPVLRRKAALAVLLLIGAVTPVAEIARSLLVPAWPVNTTATLIGAACGYYVPHYVARVAEQDVGRLLKPIHRLSPGPQGPSECRNPGHELMWSWNQPPHKSLRSAVPLPR